MTLSPSVPAGGGGARRRLLWPALPPSLRRKRRLAIASLSAATVLQLVFPWFLKLMVDASWRKAGGEVGSADAPDGWLGGGALMAADALPIWGLAVVLFVDVLLALVFSFFEFSLFAEIGERWAAALRERVFGRLVRLPMVFFTRTRVGEVVSRSLADLAIVQEFAIHEVRQVARHLGLGIGGLVMMFVVSVKMAGFVMALVPLVGLAGWFFGKRIREVATRAQAHLAESAVVFEEALQGIQSVKSFANEEVEEARFRRRVDAMLPLLVSGARLRAFFVCVILAVVFGVAVLVMWFGSREVLFGRIAPGDFMAFGFYLFFATGSLGSLAEIFGRLERAAGAESRIRELLDEPVEEEAAVPEAGEPAPLGGAVEFRDVSFTYPGGPSAPAVSGVPAERADPGSAGEEADAAGPGEGRAFALRGLSFAIRPGERVALVGPSGAGKSTLVMLLFRFFDPDRGSLRFDGRDAREFPRRSLRQAMALVPQEVILFSGTIRENVEYGRPGAGEAAVLDALERAQLGDFVRSLPDGLGTRLGDRGIGVSGGQRQRIAIARAILADPAILVLDEATSALDSASEDRVREALDALMRGRTTLIIAHRLRTVREADRILVMRDGTLVEEGTHDALVRTDGFYRFLCAETLASS